MEGLEITNGIHMNRILIIEDDYEIIKNLTILLEDEGFTASSAASLS